MHKVFCIEVYMSLFLFDSVHICDGSIFYLKTPSLLKVFFLSSTFILKKNCNIKQTSKPRAPKKYSLKKFKLTVHFNLPSDVLLHS